MRRRYQARVRTSLIEEAPPQVGTSIIIPARNEGRTLKEIISVAREYGDEVLVIDGHSKDGTDEILLELGLQPILDNRKGKGDAVRLGIERARGEILVFLDADGSHDPHDIPKLVAPIAEGRADLVIGSRMRGGSDELHGTVEMFLRMLGQAIITLSINLYYGTFLTDSQNGFRAIRAEVARQLGLRENIATIEQEMLLKTLKLGYRVEEVPSHEYARKYGSSSISLRKVWLRWAYVWLRYLFFK